MYATHWPCDLCNLNFSVFWLSALVVGPITQRAHRQSMPIITVYREVEWLIQLVSNLACSHQLLGYWCQVSYHATRRQHMNKNIFVFMSNPFKFSFSSLPARLHDTSLHSTSGNELPVGAGAPEGEVVAVNQWYLSRTVRQAISSQASKYYNYHLWLLYKLVIVYFLAAGRVFRYSSSSSFCTLGRTAMWTWKIALDTITNYCKLKNHTLYSILNSPLPCVDPRSWFEYPNMSFRATSATAVNSSSRTSLSKIVPLRVLSPPITLPETSDQDKFKKREWTTHFGIPQVPQPQRS